MSTSTISVRNCEGAVKLGMKTYEPFENSNSSNPHTHTPMKILSLLAAFAWISASFLLAANTTPRERLLMDFGWRFHLGDAQDAGDQFYRNYPLRIRIDSFTAKADDLPPCNFLSCQSFVSSLGCLPLSPQVSAWHTFSARMFQRLGMLFASGVIFYRLPELYFLNISGYLTESFYCWQWEFVGCHNFTKINGKRWSQL
jgi:hypothetical protein